MLDNPRLHASAIYNSLSADRASWVLEDLAALRVYRHGDLDEEQILPGRVFFTCNTDYNHQDRINARCGVGLLTVLQASARIDTKYGSRRTYSN